MTLSARNHLKGIVADIQLGDVLAHVTIRVSDSLIESVITRRSAERNAAEGRRRCDRRGKSNRSDDRKAVTRLRRRSSRAQRER
jgi:molybdopterin-binding protein